MVTAQISDPNYSFNLKSFPVHSDSHLEEVIYRTEVGARVDNGGLAVGAGSERSADMLTVAMRSQLEDCKVKVNICQVVEAFVIEIIKIFSTTSLSSLLWQAGLGFVY